jgi:pimeloyl-ACP methyl ester carboxylesterase
MRLPCAPAPCDPRHTIDCVTAFSETDFRPDMAKIDVPTLVIHGDDDQIVPFEATGKLAAGMIKGRQTRGLRRRTAWLRRNAY